ncbi:MAG: hypothetical protein HRU76_11520 [Phycisphaeraceae bacterium]|nr:hypothetical protein [Phycisphaerales bacterium]QOJ18181.1 MAG: hypothetical protein HRU76_11520 [Phycisphaeraceae bacterium]
MKRWFRHAFAVDKPGPAEPSDAEREVVDKVCAQIVKRHLTTPSLIFLEMSRPLNYIGSQTMHFFAPFVWAVTDPRGFETFAGFLERRGSIEYICRRIEAMEASCATRPAAPVETPGPGNSAKGA